MEHPRDGRGRGRAAGELLDHVADLLLAHPADEHIANQAIDLRHAALIMVEELGVETTAGVRHRQVVDDAGGGANRARAVAGSLVATATARARSGRHR